MEQREIQLSNGRIVTHKPCWNGATEAYMKDGKEMSNAEWLEYCDLIARKT